MREAVRLTQHGMVAGSDVMDGLVRCGQGAAQNLLARDWSALAVCVVLGSASRGDEYSAKELGRALADPGKGQQRTDQGKDQDKGPPANDKGSRTVPVVKPARLRTAHQPPSRNPREPGVMAKTRANWVTETPMAIKCQGMSRCRAWAMKKSRMESKAVHHQRQQKGLDRRPVGQKGFCRTAGPVAVAGDGPGAGRARARGPVVWPGVRPTGRTVAGPVRTASLSGLLLPRRSLPSVQKPRTGRSSPPDRGPPARPEAAPEIRSNSLSRKTERADRFRDTPWERLRATGRAPSIPTVMGTIWPGEHPRSSDR